MDADILPLIDFTKVKKKKKVVKEVPKIEETKVEESKKEEQEGKKEEQAENLSNIVLEKKKTINEEELRAENESNIIKEEYTYEFLLERVYNMIKNHNPELSSERAKLKIPPPQIAQPSKARTVWMNFNTFVDSLNRTQEHLLNFVKGELGIDMNICGTENEQLSMKGKVNKNQIESIIKKYVEDFVRCPICRSFNTIIRRDQATRLQQLYCESCRAETTIQSLKQQNVKAGKR